ncbi:hypothetical protein NDU88_008025 [Pleurodeles waltl]|uniref:Uncharacterized protein n=1 Tax=Pleurodeles waltl TaxID=8319 RepID=A0AAV7U278_PLEWA|nr:hypothetical protein NDU88_008025 [Pleurodeles waltl]
MVGFRRRLPPHPSQPQQRPLLLLHSSQVLNGLAATSEQRPPWWASEGDYPRIHRSRSGGRSFSYTAAKSWTASPPSTNSSLPGGLQKETTPASIAAAAKAAPSPTQQPSPERPRRHLRTAPSLVGFRRRLPPHPSQPRRRPLLLLHSSQVLNGLLPNPNSSLPWGLQKETTPASITAAAEAATSPTQQPSPERPPHHLRTAPSLVGFRRRLPPASIAAAAEAAASPTQQQGPERPRRHLRTAPSLVGFRRRLPPHPSQLQRRPLLLLHSSQVLNDLAATSEQLPPWWASEGDYPCIHRSRSRGRSFSYTAAKS